MIHATVREIAQWCSAELINGNEDSNRLLLSGVSTDTRHLEPGQLFVPLRGERYDGHDYIKAALDSGAAAALWDKAVPLPPQGSERVFLLVEDTLIALQAIAKAYLQQLGAKVVGITGSNGKTTTKDLIFSVLSTRYRVHKTEGNYNNHIGLPLTILNAPAQTQVVVLEMGMSGRREIALLSEIAEPDVCVITNIGEAHLLQLGTREGIAEAKLEITEGLKDGGQLVYNGDEPLLVNQIAAMKLSERVSLVTYGEMKDNHYAAANMSVTVNGTFFTVEGEVSMRVELPVPGSHNAVNALAAIAVGRIFELSPEEINTGLKAVKLTGMRIERSLASNGAIILNDAYNASPTSVKAAINLVEELSEYRFKWVVLSDMLELGSDEESYHREIGRYITAAKADYVLLYGPLSKFSFVEAEKNFPAGHVLYFEDKRTLIAYLLEKLTPDDLVLVKASRGMRMEEAVKALERGVRG